MSSSAKYASLHGTFPTFFPLPSMQLLAIPCVWKNTFHNKKIYLRAFGWYLSCRYLFASRESAIVRILCFNRKMHLLIYRLKDLKDLKEAIFAVAALFPLVGVTQAESMLTNAAIFCRFTSLGTEYLCGFVDSLDCF